MDFSSILMYHYISDKWLPLFSLFVYFICSQQLLYITHHMSQLVTAGYLWGGLTMSQQQYINCTIEHKQNVTSHDTSSICYFCNHKHCTYMHLTQIYAKSFSLWSFCQTCQLRMAHQFLLLS